MFWLVSVGMAEKEISSTKKDKLDVIKQLFCFSRMRKSQNLDLFFFVFGFTISIGFLALFFFSLPISLVLLPTY